MPSRRPPRDPEAPSLFDTGPLTEPPSPEIDEPSPEITPDPGPDQPGGAPAHIHHPSTVGEARSFVKARLREGVQCPVCDQRAQIYRRKINGQMVRSLVQMFRAGAADDFLHMPTVIGKQADEAKLAHWGLLEEEKVLRPDGGRAGWWRVTKDGVSFIRGDLRVTKYALIYDSRFLGFEGEPVDAQDCLGVGFDLQELLNGG